MHRTILLMLTFIFCLSWAEVKVEKVLETTSIKEYNQWVQRNKAKHPGLKSVLVDYTIDLKKSPMRKYEISYYAENGNRVKEDIIEDSLTEIYVPITNDRILISKVARKAGVLQTTVKNARGAAFFTVFYAVAYIGMDIYIESLEYEPDPEPEVRILNRNGQTIGILNGIGCVDHSRLCITDDERYAFKDTFLRIS